MNKIVICIACMVVFFVCLQRLKETDAADLKARIWIIVSLLGLALADILHIG